MTCVKIPLNGSQFICTLSDIDDMAIQKFLDYLVEIKKSGALLSKDALNNLSAIALVVRSMRGELQ
jgi:hypothetical protein